MNKAVQWMAVGPALVALLGGCVSGPTPAASVRPYRPEHPVVRSAPRPAMSEAHVLSGRGPAQAAPVVGTATNSVLDQGYERSDRVLRKGDRVQVTIYAPPEPFTGPNVVDEDGRINFPLIGPIVVAGKSCGQAQRDVERAYIEQKIHKTITVVIVPPESEYAVTGEVIRPGPYPLTRDLTLLQALARSGRYTEWADKTKVTLRRNNEQVEIKLADIKEGRRKDVVIIPGDVIEVPRSPW